MLHRFCTNCTVVPPQARAAEILVECQDASVLLELVSAQHQRRKHFGDELGMVVRGIFGNEVGQVIAFIS
jgi:hypothetical protein